MVNREHVWRAGYGDVLVGLAIRYLRGWSAEWTGRESDLKERTMITEGDILYAQERRRDALAFAQKQRLVREAMAARPSLAHRY